MAETKKTTLDLNKYRALLLPFLAVILIVVSFSLVVWPRAEETFQIVSSLKAKKEKEEKLAVKLASLKGLNETELVQRSKMLVEVLPETKEAMIMISVFNQVAKDSGLELEKISVTPGKIATASAEKKPEKGKIPFLEFSLSLAGSPDQVRLFTQKIQQTKPVVTIDSLSFKETNDRYYSVTTTAAAYYYAFPTTLGRIDTPLRSLNTGEKKMLEQVKDYRFPLPGTIYQQPSFKSGKINPFI